MKAWLRATACTLPFFLLTIWAAAPLAARSFVYAGLVTNHIEIYAANPESGALDQIATQETSGVPFFLTTHPNKQVLFVGLKGKTNGVESYRIDPPTGRLTLINTMALEAGPVYMGIDHSGQYLFTAPWSADQVSMTQLGKDGRLLDTSYFPTARRPHAFAADPSNRFLYVPCLGSDVIQQYQFDATTGVVTSSDPSSTATAEGAGPRLPIFHPSLGVLYQGNEKNDTISVYTIDPDSGDLHRIQTITTLPDGFDGRSNLSELHLTPNGRFLYIANRGHNSIARYRVDAAQGTIQLAGFTPVTDVTIRSFSLSSRGTFLYAADQTTGQLITFSVHPTTGALTQTGGTKTAAGIGIVIAEEF